MAKNLTAQDRSVLIKLAASLPPGSEERRAILAGLTRSRIVQDFITLDGNLWEASKILTSVDGGPEQVVYRPGQMEEIEFANELLGFALRDGEVGKIVKVWLKYANYLSSFGGPTVTNGFAIKTDHLHNGLEIPGWASSRVGRRVLYTHPETDWQIVVGAQERMIAFAFPTYGRSF